MECKFCKSCCSKAGRQENGRQRYICRGCKKYQQSEYKYVACKPGITVLIPAMVRESVGIRGIGRLLKIAKSTVIRIVKRIGSAIVNPVIPVNRKSFELDEVRTYIGNKENQYWIAYALCSETRQVVDFIVGKRSKQVLQSIVSPLLLSGIETIKTDKLNIYRSLIPAGRHISNAYNINHIERNNLNLRTHLKRLGRKTICFSKSVVMLEACLRIYFWHSSDRNISRLLHTSKC